MSEGRGGVEQNEYLCRLGVCVGVDCMSMTR